MRRAADCRVWTSRYSAASMALDNGGRPSPARLAGAGRKCVHGGIEDSRACLSAVFISTTGGGAFATAWGSSTATPSLTPRAPMVRPNASRGLHCAIGLCVRLQLVRPTRPALAAVTAPLHRASAPCQLEQSTSYQPSSVCEQPLAFTQAANRGPRAVGLTSWFTRYAVRNRGRAVMAVQKPRDQACRCGDRSSQTLCAFSNGNPAVSLIDTDVSRFRYELTICGGDKPSGLG